MQELLPLGTLRLDRESRAGEEQDRRDDGEPSAQWDRSGAEPGAIHVPPTLLGRSAKVK